MSWLGTKANSRKEGEGFNADGLVIVCRDGAVTTNMARWNAENADSPFRNCRYHFHLSPADTGTGSYRQMESRVCQSCGLYLLRRLLH